MKYVLIAACLFLLAGCENYRMSKSHPDHWRSDHNVYQNKEHNVTIQGKSMDTMTQVHKKGTDRAPYPIITEKGQRDLDESHQPKVNPAP